MNNPQSQEVIERFFNAIRYLENENIIKSRLEFCQKYGIQHSSFYRTEQNPASQMFQINWLTILICDYNISASWLLTGRGEMGFKSPPDKKPQNATRGTSGARVVQ